MTSPFDEQAIEAALRIKDAKGGKVTVISMGAPTAEKILKHAMLEYRGEGGIRTTLSNPVFDANSSYLLETGPNTSVFEVEIEIPRRIDGKLVGIGNWYEIRYIDRSTPSNTDEKIILKGKIG